MTSALSARNSLRLFLAGLAPATLFAAPVWIDGVGQITFSAGDGYQNTVVLDPVPHYDGTFQLDDTHAAGGLTASAQGGVGHFEQPNIFGFALPCGVGVSQLDASGLPHAPASLTITAAGQWGIVGQPFGPTAYGYAAFPYVCGEVGFGPDSAVSFDIQASFGPDFSTRTPISFHKDITTPGAFAFSFFDIEEMNPNAIPVGAMQDIAFTLTLTARGVDDLSEIMLCCRLPDPTTPDVGPDRFPRPGDPPPPPPPQEGGGGGGGREGDQFIRPIPEPSTYGIFALGGLAALVIARRLRR